MTASNSTRAGALFGLCALVLGCAATADRPDAVGGDGGADAGDAGAGAPERVPTTITLENVGGAPFFVGGLCGQRFLALTHEGEGLTYDRSCSCACDASGACGCPAFCDDTQELIVPGEHTSVEWDGLFARFDVPACYELAGLSRGDTVTATACWNVQADGAAVQCQDTDFAYDDEREVVIAVNHQSAARTPVRIVLDNATGGPIEIVTDECGLQGWFRLALPDERGASLGDFCPCSCNADFTQGGCPSCGPCAETVVETMAAGETRTFEWDGMFSNRYPSGCSARYAMPAGFQLTAELCFARQTGSECQPLTFVHGASEEVIATVR